MGFWKDVGSTMNIQLIFAVAVLILLAFLHWYGSRELTVSVKKLRPILQTMLMHYGKNHRVLLKLNPRNKTACIRRYTRPQGEHGVELLIPKTDWSEDIVSELVRLCNSRGIVCRTEMTECSMADDYLVIDLGDESGHANDVVVTVLVEGLGLSPSEMLAQKSNNSPQLREAAPHPVDFGMSFQWNKEKLGKRFRKRSVSVLGSSRLLARRLW